MKNWYTSKGTWLGIIQTLMGLLALLANFLELGDGSGVSVVMLLMGVLQVVIRVWFTDTGITH